MRLLRKEVRESEQKRSRLIDATSGNSLQSAALVGTTGITGVVDEGGALFAAGKFAEALAHTDTALEQHPNLPELLFARGSVLLGWGRFREALESYESAERAGLVHPDLDVSMGWAYSGAGQLDLAVDRFRRAVSAIPDAVAPWLALANAYELTGALGQHATEIEDGLASWRDNYDANVFIGGCRLARTDREGATAAFRRAIALDPARPRGWHNLGSSLDWRMHLAEATEALGRAHSLEIDQKINGVAFVNLAMAKREGGHWSEAFALLREGLARNADINGHWLYSAMLLETGQFDEGWVQHEFRWLKEPLRSVRWTIRRPQWSGQKLEGKRLVLHAEQGLGDVFQFIRYARHLKKLGATVLFDSFRGFKEISKYFEGIDEVLADGPMPEFDFHLPLISLPRVFGTNAASIPLGIPYLRVPDEFKAKWHERLGISSNLKVGLVWGGNPKHLRDHQRSIPAAMLRPLCNAPGIDFYSLQKGPQAEEARGLRLRAIDLGPELLDYRDTVAVLAELDLVISVDTSVAHAAGALGRPVWLLIPTPPDWRWLLEGNTSGWYPSMRIFRQHSRNEWEPVIQDVVDALKEFARSRRLDKPLYSQSAHAHVRDASDDSRLAATVKSPIGSWIPKLTQVTEARYGIIQYLPDAGEAARSLQFYGEYRRRELALIGRFLGAESWILDVGTGVGLSTLSFAQAVGASGHVIGFEADPLLFQIARQNLGANGASRVTLLPQTLDTSTGPDREATGATNNGAMRNCIDDLRLRRLDWIRICGSLDTARIITGGERTIWKYRPWIFVSDVEDVPDSRYRSVLRDCGYGLWDFSAPLFDPENYNRRDEDIFDGRCARGTLGIPEEINVDVELDCCSVVDTT